MSMQTEDMISADAFCAHYNIDISFIQSLNEFGLITFEVIEKNIFLKQSQLSDLEKFVRLHHELAINLEGIDTINHLLQRITELQQQNAKLSAQLHFYESE